MSGNPVHALVRRGLSLLDRGWDGFAGLPVWCVVVLVAAINVPLVLWTSQRTLQDFPNSGDEYASLVSAWLFSEGKLAVESPEPRESFDLNHVINNGRYYGKYTPGWPLLLSLGCLARVPWLVNPFLALVSMALMYRIGAEWFSAGAARAALAVTVANPFLIFTSASYFSHGACLCLVLLATFYALRARKADGHLLHPLLFGLAGGVAIAIRPLSAILLLAPSAVALLLPFQGNRGARGRLFAAAAALGGSTIPLVLFLFYNHGQTGDPLKLPFTLYNPHDHLGITPSSHSWAWGWQNNVVGRLDQINRWIPFSLGSFLLALWAGRRDALGSPVHVLALSAVALFAGHIAYLFDPGNQYGPRYLYESAGILFLMTGIAVSKLKSAALPALFLIVVLNAVQFAAATLEHTAQVSLRKDLYTLVDRQGLSRALIFLRTGSGDMDARDLTRNGIHFEREAVLYVLDRGREANGEVLENYPGRTGFLYEFSAYEGRGLLTPIADSQKK